jgi:hypothetical protein
MTFHEKDEVMPHLSTTRRLATYETALEIFNILIAERSAAIASEVAKCSPNQERIDILIREKIAIRLQSNSLNYDDLAQIERVICKFAPRIKAGEWTDWPLESRI